MVEEGLPGRTAQYDDPVMGAIMNGRPALRMALQSHGPIDVMTLMLGTNDVKTRFASTPAVPLTTLSATPTVPIGPMEKPVMLVIQADSSAIWPAWLRKKKLAVNGAWP